MDTFPIEIMTSKKRDILPASALGYSKLPVAR